MTIKSIPAKPAHPALKTGAELDVAFTDLLANGQAVGRAEGVVVFCLGPLPGESAHIRISTVKPNYVVGELLELTASSPDRTQPFCPVFGICGGCQVQHLAYPAQLRWKRELVRNALARIGGLRDVQVAEPIGMQNPRGYRNKMSLVIDPARERVGFYRQRSHDVVEIDGCPIVMPNLDRQIPLLNALRAQPQAAAAFEGVQHVVARTSQSSGQTVITFTSERHSKKLHDVLPILEETLKESVIGISNSFDLSGPNAIIGRKHEVLSGSGAIEEAIGGVRYRVSAGSFFQINVEIVERIFEFVHDRVLTSKRIVDLYCGAGTFSLYFAKLGARVLGIEENSFAVAEARANAEYNELQEAATFQCGRVEELVRRPGIRRTLAAADLIFLDPPRKGSDDATLGAVVAAGPKQIWYLSCEPATLARDLKFLTAKGYAVGEAQPFDMFPQTGHVETLVFLHAK